MRFPGSFFCHVKLTHYVRCSHKPPIQFLLFKNGKPGGQQKHRQLPSLQACMKKGLKKRETTTVYDKKGID